MKQAFTCRTLITLFCVALTASTARPALAGSQVIRGVRSQAYQKGSINFQNVALMEQFIKLPRRGIAVVPNMMFDKPLRGPAVAGMRMHWVKNRKAAALRSAPAKGGHGRIGLLNGDPPLDSFQGLDDIDHYIPPDTHGAVGPNHVISTTNDQVRIHDRSGNVISTVTLSAFWSGVAPLLYPEGPFDEKVIYDPYNNRFTLITLDTDFAGRSDLLVAVTNTGDPTGTWTQWRINADPGVNNGFFDYPSIGFNKNWIAVSGNIYPWANGPYTENTLAFDKADLYALGTAKHTVFRDVGGPGGFGGFTKQPMITYDNSVEELYLVETDVGQASFGGPVNSWRLSKITGAVGSETMDVGFATPSFGQSWSLQPDADQKDSGTPVATNDPARPASACYRNGSLWVTHSGGLPAGNPNRCSIHWAQLSTSGSVIQEGWIDDPAGVNFYYFPSIAVNSNGDVAIGFSKSSVDLYPGAYYTFRNPTDPPGTMKPETLLKDGEGPYDSFAVRWGDYSATVVDPVDDSTFWTVQEYSTSQTGSFGTTLFGTWWGHFAAIPPPISIRLNPNRVFAGEVTTATVTLRDPSQGNTVVSITSSDPSVAPVPSQVVIGDGETSTSFDITTVDTPAGASNITITATNTGTNESASALLRVESFIAAVEFFDGLFWTPVLPVTGGSLVTARVRLTQPAAEGGIVAALGSSDDGLAVVTPSVTVQAGRTTQTFYVWTKPVASTSMAEIFATANNSTRSGTLILTPPYPAAVVVSPTSVSGGTKASGTVYLSGVAPSSGLWINLTSDRPEAIVPSPYFIQPGKSYGTFTINTTAVSANTTARITAEHEVVTASGSLVITAVGVTSLSFNPSTLAGGTYTMGTVALSKPAPAGGAAIQLTKVDPLGAVPTLPTVVVPQGRTVVSFSLATKSVTQNTTVDITASYAGGSKTARLNITGVGISSLTVIPTRIRAGTAGVGRVFLNAPAPAGGVSITITTSVGSAVPQTVVVPAGATSAQFAYRAPNTVPNPPGYVTAVITGTDANGNSRSATVLVVP